MPTNDERREVAARMRNQLTYMRENGEYYKNDRDIVECGNSAYRNIADSVEKYSNIFAGYYIPIVEKLADLIDRPTCLDLVERKQDPFIPGKRMVDGYFHCSDCGWDGQIWEHIGFGDMLAYEAVHCPKCGAIIERRA